ncbi:hypothetical protein Btru_030055 [Bulinus truncatus]|nr:hypothetical protein Btru_030055 [Bulinus truncatus]
MVGSQLPPLPPKSTHGVIMIQPRSFGFLVVTGAKRETTHFTSLTKQLLHSHRGKQLTLQVDQAATEFFFSFCLIRVSTLPKMINIIFNGYLVLTLLQCLAKVHPLEEIMIDQYASQYNLDPKFLSLTIDSSEIKNCWSGFDFSSEKLMNMAHGLSPAYIRIGGTDADFLIFDPYATEKTSHVHYQAANYRYDSGFFPEGWLKDQEQFTLTGGVWRNMTTFFEVVGWDVIFDFNEFVRKKGLWDPSNATSLLNFSEDNGIKIAGFQLGNEPNSYQHNFNITITPPELVSDFIKLNNLLNNHPAYKMSSLFGPDVTNPSRGSSSVQYLQLFLQASGCDIVDYVTFHHYYLDGHTATVDQFLSEDVLNSLQECFTLVKSIMNDTSCSRSITLSETSSCYGGGAPELSNRYAAGFLWLDKLGLSALNGLAQVFRQTFYGGSYSLVSSRLEPYPDFFLSLLFKKLVSGPVLTVKKQPEKIRVYANCASNPLYPPGAIVIYFLNLRDSTVDLSLSQFASLKTDIFLLTPGDSNGLKSSYVKLNGELLNMTGTELPPLTPKTIEGVISVDPQSFGFLVVPLAKVSICMKGPA